MRGETAGAIKTVGNTELETLLEMRYLYYMDWGEISDRFGYGFNFISEGIEMR